MPPIEVYTTPFCPYCRSAKALLDRKGAAYKEIDVSGDFALRETMIQRAKGRTHRGRAEQFATGDACRSRGVIVVMIIAIAMRMIARPLLFVAHDFLRMIVFCLAMGI